MNLTSKILALLIGCTILVGISSVSAQCSYLGISEGDTFNYTIGGTYSGLPINGTMTIKINAIVGPEPCLVNYTQTVHGDVHGTMANETDTPHIANSTSAAGGGWFISKAITNKSYYASGSWGMENQTWDANGTTKYLEFTTTSPTVSDVKIQRVYPSTPPPTTPGIDPRLQQQILVIILVIIIAGIALIAIAIIIRRKKGKRRES